MDVGLVLTGRVAYYRVLLPADASEAILQIETNVLQSLVTLLLHATREWPSFRDD